ncbi:hypothetical protein HOK40_04180 [Candidatus Peregrinibacteria bacterium]|nr:hypothetical protein [Candidatus Peregrinibacteria bacterium]
MKTSAVVMTMKLIVDPTVSENHEDNLLGIRIWMLMKKAAEEHGVEVISDRGHLFKNDKRRVFQLRGHPFDIELCRTRMESCDSARNGTRQWLCMLLAA